MATYTSYLNLEKPTTSETFNLLKMNQNWDKIDAGVSALNSNFTSVLDGTKFLSKSFGSQLNLTVETNSRLIIFTVGANSSRNSLYSAGTISSGSAYAAPVITGNAVTYSTGSNSISISTDGITNALIIVLVGDVTVN